MNEYTRAEIGIELQAIKDMVDAEMQRKGMSALTKANLLRIRNCAVRASMAMALVGTQFEPEVPRA